jgi:hypothetical protein
MDFSIPGLKSWICSNLPSSGVMDESEIIDEAASKIKRTCQNVFETCNEKSLKKVSLNDPKKVVQNELTNNDSETEPPKVDENEIQNSLDLARLVLDTK